MCKKVTVVHDQLRNRCTQSAEIGLLPDWLARIAFAGYRGGVVLDGDDMMLGPQQLLADFLQVQPFVRRTADGPVVEIETVDVDCGSHQWPAQINRGLRRAPAPRVETTGEVVLEQ